MLATETINSLCERANENHRKQREKKKTKEKKT